MLANLMNALHAADKPPISDAVRSVVGDDFANAVDSVRATMRQVVPARVREMRQEGELDWLTQKEVDRWLMDDSVLVREVAYEELVPLV